MTPQPIKQPGPPTADSLTNGKGLATEGHPHVSASPSANGKGAGRCFHIAVADGDAAVRQFHQEALSRLGHQVCVADSGRHLVEQCRVLQPDLLITGVALPELGGIAAAEAVCREKPLPIILLPTDHDAEAVRGALNNPYVLACLFRPVREADLASAVLLAMSRFEQFEALCKEVTDLRQALEDRKLIERAKGMVMRYGGLDEEEAYRRLRKTASDQNRKLAEVAQTILAAGEVFRQLEQPSVGERPSAGHGRTASRGHATDQARTTAVERRNPPLHRSAP